MKNTLLLLFVLATHLLASAQTSHKAFIANRCLSASNYLAYPTPKANNLTPAPKGYHPFYLSHYGRHGSRYLISTRDYDMPYFALSKADSIGYLTPKGREVLGRLSTIRSEARGRDGELTALGAQQHKEIAKRMAENFPELFSGPTHVDAKSTVVIRCILSMENALQQLLTMNPQLQVSHDASYHDMYYMNQNDTALEKLKKSDAAMTFYKNFCKRHEYPERLMRLLFNNDNYWQTQLKAKELSRALFRLAGNMQSTDLRDSISLYDLFTNDEIYDEWTKSNAYWYITYGPSPLTDGRQPYSQRNLLHNIINEADSCMALEHTTVTLRYGHDTMVMPLTCLLNLDGLGQQIDDLEQLDAKGWRDYNIFPMACNLQFIFYRRYKGDKDVLVKILRNEHEATLPLKTDCAPYYHWNDFKAYYNKKLADYKAIHP